MNSAYTKRFIREVQRRPALWKPPSAANRNIYEQGWSELSTIFGASTSSMKGKWRRLRQSFFKELISIPQESDNVSNSLPESHVPVNCLHYDSLLFLSDMLPIWKSKQASYDATKRSALKRKGIRKARRDATNGISEVQPNDIQVDLDPLSVEVEANTAEEEVFSTDFPKNHFNSLPSVRLTRCDITTAPAALSTAKETSEGQRKPFIASDDDVELMEPPQDDNGKPLKSYVDCEFHFLMSLYPYLKQINLQRNLRVRTKIEKIIFKELYISNNDI